MMPRVLTPTWETCTNECGAGPEMIFALTGLVGNAGVLVFSFFAELVRKGRKTAVMRREGVPVVPSWETRYRVNKGKERTMTSRSVDNFFEKDGRFAVVVEAETKHPSLGRRDRVFSVNVKPCPARACHAVTRTYRSGKVVEKGLVLVVLEHLRDGEHPDDSVCLDVDEAEPVLFLQPETVCARTTVWRRNSRRESVAIASEDEDASEVRVGPVQVRVDERRIIHSDRSGCDHLLRAGLENG